MTNSAKPKTKEEILATVMLQIQGLLKSMNVRHSSEPSKHQPREGKKGECIHILHPLG